VAAADTVDVKLAPGDELPRDVWIDALKYVDPDWHAVNGDWRLEEEVEEEEGLITEPLPLSRMMLPFEMEGSYEISADFTRTDGNDHAFMLLPIGRRLSPLLLSGWGGQAHGLMRIDGFNSYDLDNPATFRPGKLVNDRRYRVLVSVETKKTEATVKVSLDGKPLIHWSGQQSSVSEVPQFALPYPQRPAVGAYEARVIFHRIALRSTSGKSRLAPPPVPPCRDEEGEGWTDLLADVDVNRDTIDGRWARVEEGVAVAPAAAREGRVRLMLPEEIEGSYNLVAEFTRTKGANSIAITLPIGTRSCTLHFSNGSDTGLESIDGYGFHRLNPAIRRPSGIVNGQRYKALVGVRLTRSPLLDDPAVLIDVWLDDKPCVRWQGRASSLTTKWKLPQTRRVGLGAYCSLVTFHSVRLQKVDEE
jgi:hypothetical protein